MSALYVVLAVFVLLTVALLVVVARRRRRRPAALEAPPRIAEIAPRMPRLPVVLAHGFLGFDAIEIAGSRHDYFRGVPQDLRSAGATVHSFGVAPIASIAVRAAQLANAVAALDQPAVHIIAHSMGGLDARYAISRLGLAPRVRSLITVATPHHGTPLADFGSLLLGERLGLGAVWKALSASGILELSTERMRRFNADVPDAPAVWYGSVIASMAGEAGGIHPLLWPTYLLLREGAGENDGLVPLCSQRWGTVLADIRADHWAQIGWSAGFDALELYRRICCELRIVEEETPEARRVGL